MKHKIASKVFLTRRELAERWSCCTHTIARMKKLKPFRFNKRLLRYRLSDIEAIEGHEVQTPEEQFSLDHYNR